MTDRPIPQQNLAQSLADLVAVTHETNRLEFERAFWLTMQREWMNIDVLRMEKFLLLTRRYLGAMLNLCAEKKWKAEVVQEQLALLEEIPLNAEDPKIPNGMRYHVIDIFVDELERAGALAEDRKGVELDVLLAPLVKLQKESPTKSVRTKCKEALGDERLPGNEGDEEMKDVEDEDEGWGGFRD
jgi:ribosomal RNA-processing protein 1